MIDYDYELILFIMLLTRLISMCLQGPCWNLTCFPPDVKCFGFCDVGTVAVPLMLQDVIKRQPVNFLTLESSYRNFMTPFIENPGMRGDPFFLYYSSHVSYVKIRVFEFVYID